MSDIWGRPRNVLLLGGTSEIGLAVLTGLPSAEEDAPRTVTLACRDVEAGERAAEDLRRHWPGVRVDVRALEATATDSHARLIDAVVASTGDLDLIILAVGQLGDAAHLDADSAAATALWQVNATGAISLAHVSATQLRAQAHGTLLVISSVAGVRVRRSNYVYGASKAALDAYAQGLADTCEGSGARVVILRPGFVRTRMTVGMAAAPFAATPTQVAETTRRGLARGQRIIWAPGVLRYVFTVLRLLPGPIWRRLPL